MAHMEGPLDMMCDTMCKFNDHMTLRDFLRSRCGKSAGSIAFSVVEDIEVDGTSGESYELPCGM